MANIGAHIISNPGGPESIFERLGGQPSLVKFVDGFYDLMATDKDTKKFFENRNLKNLKKRTVDYLGGLWGGDAYKGPDLFLAHTGLGVTVRIFEVMMKCAEKQLKVMKVKGNLSKQILDDLQSMKEPLCDPSGKLAKEYHAKNLAMGDPFDDAANRAAFAEKQRQEEERRQKLLEFRRKKQKEQAAKEARAQKEAKDAKAKAKEAKAKETAEAEDNAAERKAEVEADEDDKDSEASSEDSAMQAHLQLLQDKKDVAKGKLRSPAVASGDSGFMSLETTLEGAWTAFSEGRATTVRTEDSWSCVPQDYSVEALQDSSFCDLMDWRVSACPTPNCNSPGYFPGTSSCQLNELLEDFIEKPRESLRVRLLM